MTGRQTTLETGPPRRRRRRHNVQFSNTKKETETCCFDHNYWLYFSVHVHICCSSVMQLNKLLRASEVHRFYRRASEAPVNDWTPKKSREKPAEGRFWRVAASAEQVGQTGANQHGPVQRRVTLPVLSWKPRHDFLSCLSLRPHATQLCLADCSQLCSAARGFKSSSSRSVAAGLSPTPPSQFCPLGFCLCLSLIHRLPV